MQMDNERKYVAKSGDTEDSMWSAGQSLGLIHIPTCKVLVDLEL